MRRFAVFINTIIATLETRLARLSRSEESNSIFQYCSLSLSFLVGKSLEAL